MAPEQVLRITGTPEAVNRNEFLGTNNPYPTHGFIEQARVTERQLIILLLKQTKLFLIRF
jgi:hypothetical protein